MIHLRFLGLFVVMLTMFSMSALAGNNTYYSKATANAVGNGKVYVSKTQATPSTYNTTSSATNSEEAKSEPKHKYYLYAQANSGYEFVGWFNDQNCTGTALSTSIPYIVEITASSTTENSPTSATYYALFKPVFKFSATANTINGSYGTTTATVTSKILGDVGNTSKSTTATFTATPNANCTFEGWFSIVGTDTTLVSTSAKYTPTINNTSVGTEASLTLYAWFKANQTLTWTQDPYNPNVVAGITHTGLAAATAKSAVSGSATGLAVTYTSNSPSVATVNSSGDVTGVKASVDAITITARQAGNNEYNAVEATRQFTVINKFQPTFDTSGFQSSSVNDYTSYVDDTPTITVANTTSGFTYVSSDPTVVSISKSGNVITLTALKVGSSTVTLNDPGNTTHYSASATYNITVAKVPNGLAASLASLTANPDGTIAVTFTGNNNTGTAIVGTITNQVLSSSVNNGSDVITYADGVITAKNAGAAKITFTQAATDKYAAWTSSTYDITVTKLSNPISITLAGGSATNIKLKYGATASLSYTYANTTGAAPTVTRTSGSFTTYSSGTITAGSTQGTDIYEIRQAETYKYEAGLASFTIRVNNSDEKEGYVLYEEAEESHTPTSTQGTYFSEHTLNGPGEILSFKAHRSVAGVTKLEVQCYVNGSWQTGDNAAMYTESLSTSYGGDITCDIPESATKIRFFLRVGSTLKHCIKDVKVTRKTYVRASSDRTAFGTVYTDVTPKPTATITVNYSSTNGGNISINSNNSHFVPSITSISVQSEKTATSSQGTTYICGVDGTKTFTVTYTPDPDHLGPESATITIGDLFYSQTITLTATAAKRANTLAIIEDQSVKVDDVIANVYSSKNSDATITPTIENITGENVITYNLSTNKITAVGAGTARLTLTQPATDYYYGATKSVVLTVNKYDQTLTWDYDLDEAARTLEVGVSPVLTTNTATGSPTGLAVTYSSSNPTALEVDVETGALTAKGGGANIIITATQAGNYKYNAASITRSFNVIKRDYVTVYTSLTDGTNLFPLGGDNITIRPDALITESALTIADETIVSASFSSNTFTLTALKEGTTTVRLVREQTDDFYALDVTYTIQVVKPVLVLNPTETPVIEFSEYGTVTLSRTLPAGYSSLALPFSTTVAALTGRAANADDWVAQLETVTYSQADGYTLHFNKVTDGDITANQPYILHLGATVTNPTWTNVEVEEAEETTVEAKAGYGNNVGAAGIFSDWSMTSNFNPEMSMSGRYGVVNGAGALKKGGSTATLKAFSAYIEGPASSAGVKVQSAFTDEWGVTTYIKGLPDEGAESEACGDELYDLSGRRIDSRQQPTRGIYVRGGRRVVVK